MKLKDLFWIVVLGGAAMFAYDKYTTKAPEVPPQAPVTTKALVQASTVEDRSWIKPRETSAGASSAGGSTCDGRTHCSQMRSCSEAKYFIASCPNTKMDGDGDGIPCEEQWCG